MMRAIASASVLKFGWRVGIRAEEADPHAEEALHYARKFADDETGPELLMHYGRFKAQMGPADLYAAVMEEALATPTTDLGRTATFQGCLAQAHWMSGFLLKAEAACDAALKLLATRQQQGVNGIVGLDLQPHTLFDVELWIKCMKARILVWLGHSDKAGILLGEVSRAEGTNWETPIVQSIAHLASVELACYRSDRVAAREHAQRLCVYADQSDIPYLRVYALFATACAKTCAGACADAVRDLQAALEFAAAMSAGRENQSHLLAELGYAQYRSGYFDEAAETARAAIEMARDRRHRTAECLACMVHAAGTALSKGTTTKLGADEYFGRAEDLICQTGAVLLAPRLETLRSDVQARLR